MENFENNKKGAIGANSNFLDNPSKEDKEDIFDEIKNDEETIEVTSLVDKKNKDILLDVNYLNKKNGKTKEIELIYEDDDILKNNDVDMEKNKNIQKNDIKRSIKINVINKNGLAKISDLKEIAKEKYNIKNIQNLNKFDLLIVLWRFISKENLRIIAKSQFKIDDIKKSEKEDLIRSICETKNLSFIKNTARKLSIKNISTLHKDEIIKKLINANWKEIFNSDEKQKEEND